MTLIEKEWFIQMPWGRLCVLAWGSCLNPPVVLCHGALDSAATFRPLVKLLPEKFYYIGIELPGNGRSDRLPSGLMISLYDLVYVLDRVERHFRWDTFTFIGHSLGALVVLLDAWSATRDPVENPEEDPRIQDRNCRPKSDGNTRKLYNVTCPKKISKLVELDPINFLGVEPEHFAQWYHYFFTNYYKNYNTYNLPLEKAQKHTRAKAIESIKKVRGISDDIAAQTLDRWSEPVGNGLIRYTLDQRFKLVTLPPFSLDHIKTLFFNLKTPTLTLVSEQSVEKGLYRNTAFLLEEKNYPNNNVRSIRIDGNHDFHVIFPEKVAPFISQFLLNGVEGIDVKAKI